MKTILISLSLMFTSVIMAQNVIEITYLDIPANKISRFLELHKTITDMSMDDQRTLKGHWVYRHWYGSGASVVIFDQYDSAVDAINDDFNAAYMKAYEKLSDDQKKEADANFAEWWSFFKGHWDEIRRVDYQNYYVSKENLDWDIPYVFVVGSYNTTEKLGEVANAYMDWQIRPNVNNKTQLMGAASSHYKGSGSDLQFYAAFANIVDFAQTVSTQGSDNTEARTKFWNAVSGAHEDQIYRHIGHISNGKFDFAGKE